MSDRPYPKCCEELDAYQSSAAEIQDELERLRTTLAQIRDWAKSNEHGWKGDDPYVTAAREVLAILGEGK